MTTCAALVTAAALVLAAAPPAPAQTAVLISEMCDPHLNYATDRFIEIYNAGSEVADLTGWSLVAVGNLGDVFTWPLSGSIDPGEALVAGDYTTTVPFQVDFADEAWSSSNSLWNGKVGDGAKLLNASSIVVDYAVVDGTAFENADYERNYGVVLPSTTYDALEWTSASVEYATEGSPGAHSSAPPVPGPLVSGVATDPAAPLAGETVDIRADVTDTVAVTSVSVFWGTSQFTLPNEIAMSPESGDTYVTDSPIPAHTAGTTVYYSIHATNALPGTTVTDVASYSLPFVVSVSEIQGTGTVSPYNGYAVITHGVVTGSYGELFSIQDGTGARSGLWAATGAAPALGDSVTIRGTVTENHDVVSAGNTIVADAVVQSAAPGAVVPAPASVSTAVSSTEDYEGVLVGVDDAVCTDAFLGLGKWQVNDGSGAGRVDDLGYAFEPALGTTYAVTGPVACVDAGYAIEPRGAADVVWVEDLAAPSVYQVYAEDGVSVVVTFSEPVDEATCETPSNYSIAGLDVVAAERDAVNADQALLTVSSMAPGEFTLVVDGVEDLYSNVMDSVSCTFDYVDTSVPPGYYDGAERLAGDDLRAALHEIIDDHTVLTYTYSWEAFYTTDDKPNGKVWDMYSDVPGGVPPYEYTFGVDEGGIGGVEGTGYNREHAWPSSWSGGELLPKYSDLHTLYPTDNFVNNQRGNEAYGEVDSPAWTSLNGSKKGANCYPGYSGLAFEPIDEYKGDLARTYFYVTVRYYTEDAAWSTSAMTDGADILPWAVSMLLEWHEADPVDRKELERNGTVYGMQGNRNPFIDRPEFADLMYQAAGVEGGDGADGRAFALHQNAPNPFNPTTAIAFDLPQAADVRVAVYDVSGRLVGVVAEGRMPAGEHEVVWSGLDAGGRPVASGVYFCTVSAGASEGRLRMVLLK